MRWAVVVAVLAVTFLLSSCSNGSDDEATLSTPTTLLETTSSSSSSSSTTVATSTTVASRPTTTSASASPEGAARSLYDAWTRDDRAAAERVARPEAVTTLFARRWQAGDGWAFSECSGAAGSFICTWQRPAGEQLLFRVPSAAGGTGSTVSEVRFQP
jgi:hypothetical protein